MEVIKGYYQKEDFLIIEKRVRGESDMSVFLLGGFAFVQPDPNRHPSRWEWARWAIATPALQIICCCLSYDNDGSKDDKKLLGDIAVLCGFWKLEARRLNVQALPPNIPGEWEELARKGIRSPIGLAECFEHNLRFQPECF